MIPFQLHRRIPLLRRPFFQRDRALAERDQIAAEREALMAQLEALIADNNRLGTEVAILLRDSGQPPLDVRPPPSRIKVVSPDRRKALCRLIDISGGKGIEFGPLSKPIIRSEEGDIRYIDHASTAELREKYAVDNGYDQSEFVEISYAWSNGPLRNAIKDGTIFDYALASHVIEHVPNVIWWLSEVFSVLRDGGIFALAIPDGRYTFDCYRSTTTAAMLIDHWLGQLRGHSPQQVFDSYSQVIKVGVDEIKALFDGQGVVGERYYTPDFALKVARSASESSQYIECHASVFTPRSFLEIMKTLIGLGLVEAEVIDFYDTRRYGQEFICVMKKSTSRNVAFIADAIKHLA
jgi:hypothetical protein